GMKSSFEVWVNKSRLGSVSLNLPGEHNVYNALAAVTVGRELEIDFKDIKAGLEGFTGVERRFHLRGTAAGVMVVDDYGHHPEEIKAVLRAAKKGWDKRVVVVFQPHRYTRTRDLFEDFLSAFNDAEKLVLTEVYAAGEERIESVGGQALYEGIKAYGHKDVSFVKDVSEIPGFLADELEDGDMVLTLGAGDVWKVGSAVLELLNKLKGRG
ncbi:MAG: UDP-N-acetylmuramate--L-alanine ligase, partial [Nitrospirota bacterium]|nr:UDP-N-acetylmuramate--L-alanine ligase [Nitrospirota bacterium]